MNESPPQPSAVEFSRNPAGMPQYRLSSSIFIRAPIGEVFAFFADAGNLQKLTPEWLSFSILTQTPIEMRAGTLIDYRLRVHGIPLRWQSEITSWNPPYEFSDTQRRGPYRHWHHLHTFKEHDGGTLVGDQVDYDVPGGSLVNGLFVKRDLARIFAYRHAALQKMFPVG